MHVDIEPLFKTTLAEPVQLPGSTIRHEKGAEVVFNHKMETKSLGPIMFIAPLPAHLMLNETCRLASELAGAFTKVQAANKQQVFSSLNTDPAMTAERALREDPEAKLIGNLPKEEVYVFLQKAAAFHFHLIAAIEAFCNQMIPSNHTVIDPKVRPSERFYQLLSCIGLGKKRRVFDKPAIERFFSIDQKIDLVVSLKSKDGIKQQKFWQTFKEVKNVRDAVVHLKNGGVAFAGYEPTYAKLFDTDYNKSVHDVVDMLNYLRPDFVKLVE